MAKERDNTWLQLPVCPLIWRQKDVDKLEKCSEESQCQLSYAHPPDHVLKLALASGFVVSCQSFVFSTYGPDDGSISRPKCKRGEENCKYFHPPKHLSLQVINMGRNNKRMKQELLSKMKLIQQSQQQFQQHQTLPTIWPNQNPFFYPVLSMPGVGQSVQAQPTNQQQLRQVHGQAAAAGALLFDSTPSTATTSANALLRKRPRNAGNTEDHPDLDKLNSPEAKRRSKELSELQTVQAQLVIPPGTIEYQFVPNSSVIYYDASTMMRYQ